MANTRPNLSKTRRQELITQQVVAAAQVKAASDSAVVADQINNSLINVDLTTENTALKNRLDDIQAQIDSLS